MSEEEELPPQPLTPDDLPDTFCLDSDIDDLYSQYTPELHGELTDDDIETITVKLSDIFNSFDLYEVQLTNIKINPKLDLLLNFMGLAISKRQKDLMTVTKKEWAPFLQEYTKLKSTKL